MSVSGDNSSRVQEDRPDPWKEFKTFTRGIGEAAAGVEAPQNVRLRRATAHSLMLCAASAVAMAYSLSRGGKWLELSAVIGGASFVNMAFALNTHRKPYTRLREADAELKKHIKKLEKSDDGNERLQQKASKRLQESEGQLGRLLRYVDVHTELDPQVWQRRVDVAKAQTRATWRGALVPALLLASVSVGSIALIESRNPLYASLGVAGLWGSLWSAATLGLYFATLSAEQVLLRQGAERTRNAAISHSIVRGDQPALEEQQRATLDCLHLATTSYGTKRLYHPTYEALQGLFASYPNVKHLELGGKHLDGEALAFFATQDRLERLEIAGGEAFELDRLSGKRLRQLRLPRLLYSYGPDVTKRFKVLNRVHLKEVTREGLETLKKISSVVDIRYSRGPNRVSIDHFHTKIEKLSLFSLVPCESAASYLSLKSLQLGYATRETFSAIRQLPKLHKLSISDWSHNVPTNALDWLITEAHGIREMTLPGIRGFKPETLDKLRQQFRIIWFDQDKEEHEIKSKEQLNDYLASELREEKVIFREHSGSMF